METIDIVFDGPPGPESGRFVEVERDGKSIRLGEWVQRRDGLWALRIPDPESRQRALAMLMDAPRVGDDTSDRACGKRYTGGTCRLVRGHVGHCQD